MQTLTWHEEIPVKESYDVIVAGGGVAGVAAALSAGRMGKKVLLLEKQTWLGGLATTGLVNFWVPLCNGRGKMIIRGMAEEFLKLSFAYGFDTLPPEWKNGEPEKPTNARLCSWYSSGLYALSLLKLLKDAGVKILYDALVSTPVMDGTHCRGLIVDGKSGRFFYEAGVVVDATGDADLLKRAGMPTIDGSNYFTCYGEGITLKGCEEAIKHQNVYYAYYHPYGGTSNLYGKGHPEDMPTFKGAEMETINDFLQQNHLLMLEKEKDKPRFERNIHMLPGMAQLRTSRHLDGDAALTGEDCYKHCDTSIGAICDFDNRDRLYEVPYGTLVRTGYNNLITCGRSASASGWGWDVLRVIPPAILTGQAAGIACAMSLDGNCAIHAVSVPVLQQKLADTGVVIHFDDAWVPDEKADDEFAPPDGHV